MIIEKLKNIKRIINGISEYKKEAIGAIVIILIFLIVSYFTGIYSDLIKETSWLKGEFGVYLYIFVIVMAVVIAPLSAMPLLPIAVALWGPFLAAVISIVGWSLGAVIAFALARSVGKPIISRFVNLDKAKKLESIIPKTHVFWGVVFLRMALPVDILSYTLGLFSNMSIYLYSLATLIGITPFAFVFAYSVKLPIYYQAAVIITGVLIIFFGYLGIKSKYKIL